MHLYLLPKFAVGKYALQLSEGDGCQSFFPLHTKRGGNQEFQPISLSHFCAMNYQKAIRHTRTRARHSQITALGNPSQRAHCIQSQSAPIPKFADVVYALLLQRAESLLVFRTKDTGGKTKKVDPIFILHFCAMG